MWKEPNISARNCAEEFTKLMSERPDNWADNLITAVKDMKSGDEQLRFLAWCADPKNVCGTKDRKIECGTIDSKQSFENDPRFEVTRVVEGKHRTVHLKYCPDDEKSLQ